MPENVTISREHALNAEAACHATAHKYRKQARLRSNAGHRMAAHRAWLRTVANAAEAAAADLRRGIDNADLRRYGRPLQGTIAG